MITSLVTVLLAVTAPVPDSGTTALFLLGAVGATAALARFFKK
jgi:hypothetical protein